MGWDFPGEGDWEDYKFKQGKKKSGVEFEDGGHSLSVDNIKRIGKSLFLQKLCPGLTWITLFNFYY